MILRVRSGSAGIAQLGVMECLAGYIGRLILLEPRLVREGLLPVLAAQL